ncbi:hypothetical protein INP57_17315 [Saccharopolyspora sp. HNM0986]|uniref:hypothetical protein n=1 Tax=Saccharopolyspora galaxeae TaxID=2781241 RepID=UPI00190B9CEE|nr:hypothetical protein [Saccharopolyspora sp. HNM0986]MBK0868576.1 hypothetical protein [Saccharopolyspora sp. HNM0986]
MIAPTRRGTRGKIALAQRSSNAMWRSAMKEGAMKEGAMKEGAMKEGAMKEEARNPRRRMIGDRLADRAARDHQAAANSAWQAKRIST